MPKKVSKPKSDMMDRSAQTVSTSSDLIQELRQIIEQSRMQVAQAVNAGLSLLYWQIGKRVQVEILKGERAEYGQALLKNLSQDLTAAYGRSFQEKNLRRMVQFAEAFPDQEIVVSLIRQLSWTHVATQGATGAGLLRANVQPGTLECAHVARARELDAV